MKLSPFYSDSINPCIPIINEKALFIYYNGSYESDTDYYSYFITTKKLCVKVELLQNFNMRIIIYRTLNRWHVCEYIRLKKNFSIFCSSGPHFIKCHHTSRRISNIIRQFNFSSICKDKLYKDCINYERLIQNLVIFF